MKKKIYVFMFIKGPRKMNMIEQHRNVQEDGTLDLRGIDYIKNDKYRSNYSIKTIIIGSSVQTIESWAFSVCQNVEKIIFEEPCQITKLTHGCFADCSNLRKIDLPSSIEEIDRHAFLWCPLERVILQGPCYIGPYCFHTNALTYLHIADSIQELDENAFYQNTNLPLCKAPCKIYIRSEFHDEIKRMFQGREVEFIGNELEEGYVLK